MIIFLVESLDQWFQLIWFIFYLIQSFACFLSGDPIPSILNWIVVTQLFKWQNTLFLETVFQPLSQLPLSLPILFPTFIMIYHWMIFSRAHDDASHLDFSCGSRLWFLLLESSLAASCLINHETATNSSCLCTSLPVSDTKIEKTKLTPNCSRKRTRNSLVSSDYPHCCLAAFYLHPVQEALFTGCVLW